MKNLKRNLYQNLSFNDLVAQVKKKSLKKRPLRCSLRAKIKTWASCLQSYHEFDIQTSSNNCELCSCLRSCAMLLNGDFLKLNELMENQLMYALICLGSLVTNKCKRKTTGKALMEKVIEKWVSEIKSSLTVVIASVVVRDTHFYSSFTKQKNAQTNSILNEGLKYLITYCSSQLELSSLNDGTFVQLANVIDMSLHFMSDLCDEYIGEIFFHQALSYYVKFTNRVDNTDKNLSQHISVLSSILIQVLIALVFNNDVEGLISRQFVVKYLTTPTLFRLMCKNHAEITLDKVVSLKLLVMILYLRSKCCKQGISLQRNLVPLNEMIRLLLKYRITKLIQGLLVENSIIDENRFPKVCHLNCIFDAIRLELRLDWSFMYSFKVRKNVPIMKCWCLPFIESGMILEMQRNNATREESSEKFGEIGGALLMAFLNTSNECITDFFDIIGSVPFTNEVMNTYLSIFILIYYHDGLRTFMLMHRTHLYRVMHIVLSRGVKSQGLSFYGNFKLLEYLIHLRDSCQEQCRDKIYIQPENIPFVQRLQVLLCYKHAPFNTVVDLPYSLDDLFQCSPLLANKICRGIQGSLTVINSSSYEVGVTFLTLICSNRQDITIASSHLAFSSCLDLLKMAKTFDVAPCVIQAYRQRCLGHICYANALKMLHESRTVDDVLSQEIFSWITGASENLTQSINNQVAGIFEADTISELIVDRVLQKQY